MIFLLRILLGTTLTLIGVMIRSSVVEPEEPDSLHTGANTWVWGGADTVLPCLAAGTLIIAPPGSWLRRDFINSITGLMTGPGTPWVTRYNGELREPLLWRQGSQVSMRVQQRSV